MNPFKFRPQSQYTESFPVGFEVLDVSLNPVVLDRPFGQVLDGSLKIKSPSCWPSKPLLVMDTSSRTWKIQLGNGPLIEVFLDEKLPPTSFEIKPPFALLLCTAGRISWQIEAQGLFLQPSPSSRRDNQTGLSPSMKAESEKTVSYVQGSGNGVLVLRIRDDQEKRNGQNSRKISGSTWMTLKIRIGRLSPSSRLTSISPKLTPSTQSPTGEMLAALKPASVDGVDIKTAV